MSKFIFSGIIRDVQVFGSKAVKMIKYKVETIRQHKNHETKQMEDVIEIYYLKQWGKKIDAFKVNQSGHFIGQIDYRRITSKKAVLIEGGEAFTYGGFDFTLEYFVEDYKGLKLWIESNYSEWKLGSIENNDLDHDYE